MTSGDRGGASPDHDGAPSPATGDPLVEVVVPVLDEERRLEAGVRGLRAYLDGRPELPTLVTIVDNGSTDATPGLARRLADELEGVRVVRIEERGRGLALRTAWSRSTAPVVAYMDVDLSTELDAFLPLVTPLIDGTGDVAVGSRLVPGARVRRSPRREVLSRGYNALVRAALGCPVADAQCGFKAARRPVVDRLLPLVADNGWFFDTELLVAARRLGLRVAEVPVTWVENTDSRVRLVHTVKEDLKGIARLRRHPVAVEPSAATATDHPEPAPLGPGVSGAG